MHRKQQKVPCSPVENDYLSLASIRPIRSETARLWLEDELRIGIHFSTVMAAGIYRQQGNWITASPLAAMKDGSL
jgi:hypothetical protein